MTDKLTLLQRLHRAWTESPSEKAARTGRPVNCGNYTANPPPTGRRPKPPPTPPLPPIRPGEIVELRPGESFWPVSLLRIFDRIDTELGQYLNEAGRANWWYRDHPDLGSPPIRALLDHEWQSVERLSPLVDDEQVQEGEQPEEVPPR